MIFVKKMNLPIFSIHNLDSIMRLQVAIVVHTLFDVLLLLLSPPHSWETFKVKYFNGALYFLTFIDDYFRKLYFYALKTKDQVLKKIKKFHALVERKSYKKLKSNTHEKTPLETP
ncbi:hypothetical protein CR513_05684, partial [Mucuna pruriens]